MTPIDARRPGGHGPALLMYWRNCPDCAADGPWSPNRDLPRAGGGKKTSIWLSDELLAGWRASQLPLGELVRRGLEMETPTRPLDEATLRRAVREIVREELAGVSVASDRSPARYVADEYEPEPYLQDP